uniref:Uncharacterized protein n=1 Tax=Strongyloides stercoralis TaxID=6248 RepID=A0AAF5DMN6_STRER
GCLTKIEFAQFLPIVYLISKAIRKPKFQLEFSKKFGPSQVNPLELEDLFNVASRVLPFSHVLKAVLTLILIPVLRSHKETSLSRERGQKGEGREKKGGKKEKERGKKEGEKGSTKKRRNMREKRKKKTRKRRRKGKKTHKWRKKESKKASGF